MEKNELSSLWSYIIDFTLDQVEPGNRAIMGFLTTIAPVDFVDDTFTLAVKTEFSKEYIERHYNDLFNNALLGVLGFPCHIAYTTDQPYVDKYIEKFPNPRLTSIMSTSVQSAPVAATPSTADLPAQGTPSPIWRETQPPSSFEEQSAPAAGPSPSEPDMKPDQQPLPEEERISTGRQIILPPSSNSTSSEELQTLINPQGTYNPKFTFQNFVVGPSNEFARAAALKVAEEPGKSYNPLFIYGHAGLGKTHLLNAIANYVKDNYEYMRVVYVTSENFVNDVVTAARRDLWDNFMLKYRSADVLLIDDIQFLQGKDSSVQQLFNTFNALKNEGSAIVLSADRPPKEIDMDERMRSRFIDGLNVEITAPNFEMRYAILKNYLENEPETQGLSISDDVLIYIAKISTNNIRELDGAIQKVVAWMLLYEKTSIEVNKVAEVLNDFFPEQHTMQVDISTIQSVVERQFDVTHEELVGSKRTRNINEARQVAMFLSRQLTDKSFPDIGTYFGNRDHTTIMHGVKKIEELMSHDEAVYKQIENLRSLINEHTQNQ